MHMITRRYKASNLAEVVRRVTEGYVPIIRSAPGFVAYYVVDLGENELMSVQVFETKAEADEAGKRVATWVPENLGDVISSPHEVVTGNVVIHETI